MNEQSENFTNGSKLAGRMLYLLQTDDRASLELDEAELLASNAIAGEIKDPEAFYEYINGFVYAVFSLWVSHVKRGSLDNTTELSDPDPS